MAWNKAWIAAWLLFAAAIVLGCGGDDDAVGADGGPVDGGRADGARPLDGALADAGWREEDECALGLDDCADDATCIDETAGYRCVCDEGLIGDGRVCVTRPEHTTASAGIEHSCRIRAGVVQCFGDNFLGQLGIGSRRVSSIPVDVDLPTSAVEVTAGYASSCALTEDGALYCWGARPAIGIATTAPFVTTPMRVGDATDWERVVSTSEPGAGFTCGIRGGALWCWGASIAGSLGDSDIPIRAGDRSDWREVAIAAARACGITREGALYCWGSDFSANVAAPVALEPGTQFQSVSVNSVSSCAVDTTGGLWCWGQRAVWNPEEPGAAPVPELARPERDWVAVAMATGSICGVRRDGSLWCAGQLYPRWRVEPWIERPMAEPAVAVDVGGFTHGCATAASGQIYCFGANRRGQLGLGVIGDHGAPHSTGTDGWRQMSGSLFQTCLIGADDGLYCAGEIRLGDGAGVVGRQVPTRIGDAQWRASAVTTRSLFGIRADGSLWALGDDALGLGDTDTTLELMRVGTATDWTAIAASYGGHACGIRAGELSCWGSGRHGATGDPTAPSDVPVPTRVGADTDWTTVSVASGRTCAVRATGALVCFGDRFAAPSGTLTPIGAGLSWQRVEVGDRGACGIAEGALYCWGDNSSGVVPGGPTRSDDPLQVGTDTGWTAVAVGTPITCGVRGGGLYCWGTNVETLEDPEITPARHDALTRIGADADWTDVMFRGSHLCGLRGSGALYCWGASDNGAVANGDVWRDDPTLVP